MSDFVNIEKLIKDQGYHISTTSGCSMYPMLRDRKDTVVIRPVSSKLKKYDIPLYKVDDKYVLHRVIGVKPNVYVVCGDNCIQKELVSDEQIIGVLSEFYRGNKKVNMNGLGYRFYTRMWVLLYPVRVFAKKVRGKLWNSRK